MAPFAALLCLVFLFIYSGRFEGDFSTVYGGRADTGYGMLLSYVYKCRKAAGHNTG